MSNRAKSLEALAVWARRAIRQNQNGPAVGRDGREYVRISKNHCEGMIRTILADLGEMEPLDGTASGRSYGGAAPAKLLDRLQHDFALTKQWGDDPYNVDTPDELLPDASPLTDRSGARSTIEDGTE